MNGINARRPVAFMRVLIFCLAFIPVHPLLHSSEIDADSHEIRWPRFRGVNGSGVAQGRLPEDFDAERHLIWKVPIPGGNSSPCVWNDRIFLTGFRDASLLTFCLDRRSGELLWEQTIKPESLDRGHRNAGLASSTPCVDGEQVYAYFGSFGLACYDWSGKEFWRRPMPIPVTQHGASTSPILAGNRLILAVDQDVGSFLLAVDKQTGATIWKTDRSQFKRGFSTPALWPSREPAQVVVAGSLQIAGYDLETGEPVWHANGLPNEMVSSPVVDGRRIVVSGWTPGSGVSRMPSFETLLREGDKNGDGRLSRNEAPDGPARRHFQYNDADKDGAIDAEEWRAISRVFDQSENSMMMIDPTDARGDITSTHVRWKQHRGLAYVSSPLIYEGRVYLVKDGGMASCFDLETGKPRFLEERLGPIGNYYSSPIAFGGRVAVCSQSGRMVFFNAADALEVAAVFPLGEETLASPALAGGRLYVRGSESLFCFGRDVD